MGDALSSQASLVGGGFGDTGCIISLGLSRSLLEGEKKRDEG